MKKLLILLFFLSLHLMFANYSFALKAIVTIEPQKYFLLKLSGDISQITVLVPPGADLHTFEFKPSQVKDIAEARIYFTIGDTIENILKEKIRAINKNIIIIDTDKGIEKIPLVGHEHHHEHGLKSKNEKSLHHNNHDPHIWLSPSLVKIIAKNMLEGLVSVNPENSQLFLGKYNDFIKEIDDLDREIREILKNITEDKKKFLIFHPSFSYFARDYGLTQIPIEYKGREPSPKKLQEIIKKARENNIKKIFIQPQISSRTADIIAKEIGAKVVVINDLAPNWGENLKDVASKLIE